MSSISGIASLFGNSQTDTTSSLRPFANLDLTEDQRTAIRALFKKAKSDGLSQDQVQQELSSILTPSQQSTLQSDLQAQSTDTSTSDGSAASAAASAAPPPPSGGPQGGGNPFADPNGPFANLDLTTDQQTQIAQIFTDAKSQGLTFDQINAKISALLTTTQQATFATDLANLPKPGSDDGSASSDLIANLSLTDDQKTKIDQILQNAQSQGTSQSDVLAQIEAVLTPTQLTAFIGDVQTAQATVSGQSATRSGGTGTTSSSSSGTTATLSNGLTETDIQKQIAAAESIILQQFQTDVGAFS